MHTQIPWDSSARAYANLAPQISFFRETSRHIVQFASLRDNMSIVDLACGSSGLTTAEMLRQHPTLRNIYCVDASKDMLAVAANQTNAVKVKYVCCAAADLHRHLPEDVDVVICNSAFWLLNIEETLKSLKQILLPDGVLVFNLAEWDLAFDRIPENPKTEAVDKQLAIRGLPIKESRRSWHRFSLDEISNFIQAARFSILETAELTVSVTAEDWSNFYRVPALAKRSLPTLPVELATEVLCRAMEELHDRRLPPVKWVEFRIENQR